MVVADAVLYLLFDHLAIADPVVVIGGDGQLLGAVIDGEQHMVAGHKAGGGEQAIDGDLPWEGWPVMVPGSPCKI
ncbi:hypothetical protein WJ95_28455 [Burkholderia ubonensis]|uniref:hypothetical protein n=1 Tax=Burkholderia ubonensis TaxID=101571 RepID=UPI00075E7F58|nr:hypothetical protein [Burkholderia ubonensis]KVQ00227.1 hypothetical protein WJ95_28455 [Burkholderia ubonensis]KVT82203.1 hypothetical protein WK58_05840 [Burkholderia ubonensis]KVW60095.1 hypothetical protein WK98_01020 [Burkholderia ubonensis]KWB55960.1 hypothetical protein WL37_31440 [Burkholderia ubonensis]